MGIEFSSRRTGTWHRFEQYQPPALSLVCRPVDGQSDRIPHYPCHESAHKQPKSFNRRPGCTEFKQKYISQIFRCSDRHRRAGGRCRTFELRWSDERGVGAAIANASGRHGRSHSQCQQHGLRTCLCGKRIDREREPDEFRNCGSQHLAGDDLGDWLYDRRGKLDGTASRGAEHHRSSAIRTAICRGRHGHHDSDERRDEFAA